jgi:hypothetical protein
VARLPISCESPKRPHEGHGGSVLSNIRTLMIVRLSWFQSFQYEAGRNEVAVPT